MRRVSAAISAAVPPAWPVPAVSRGGNPDKNISFTAERFHLAFEYILVAIVVSDGRQNR